MSAKRKSSAMSTPAHSAARRTRSRMQSAAESVAESVAESGAESGAESAAESAAESVAESGAESVAASRVESASESHLEEEIDVDDLDLDVSYVGKIKLPDPPERPKRKRWTHKGAEPIMLIKDVPQGWNTEEPDLDPDDVDALIARCKERINVDRILPDMFKGKLARLEKEKNRRENLMANYPGLSWNVVKRIVQLDGAVKYLEKRHLEGRKGEYERLQTALAIQEAYRVGDLGLHAGLVTYWAEGRRLSEPRPENYAELRAIGRRYGKEGGFWVEEGSVPSYSIKVLDHVPCMGSLTTHRKAMTIRVRYPGTHAGQDLVFADDTGSDFMTLLDSDIDDLDNFYRLQGFNVNTISPQLIRPIPVNTFSGNEEWHDLYQVEVAFPDTNGALLTTWDRINVLVLADPIGGPTPDRVNGPWLRYKLHTSTAPTRRVEMGIFRIKSAIARGTSVGVQPPEARVMR